MRNSDLKTPLLIIALLALTFPLACSLAGAVTGTPTPATTRHPETATSPPAPTPTPKPAAGDCQSPLDEEILNRLEFSLGALSLTSELQPGGPYPIQLGVVECCYIFEPVAACATWSVEPAQGASIDLLTGAFSVDADTPNGSVFTIRADVEDGRRIVSQDVYIYTPQGNPLVRFWAESAQLACDSSEEVGSNAPIGELHFRADGTFSVTWYPFEMYRDYWGTYTYDLESMVLELVIAGGNHVPEDIDGSGTFSIDADGRLILQDLWLGSPSGESLSINCGYIFE